MKIAKFQFKVSAAVPVLLTLFFGASETTAQDVYNFYFQKVPGAQPALNPASTGPAAAPPTLPAGSVPIPASSGAPATTTAIIPVAASNPTDEIRHWSLQAGKAFVSDAASDVYVDAKSRFFLQTGYRFNKYVAAEAGATFGSTEGGWDTVVPGENYLSSVVPFVGARITPLSMHFFGREWLEFFVSGGVMRIDSSDKYKSRYRYPYSYPYYEGSKKDPAEIKFSLGGGMRITFSDRFGLEIAGKALDDNRKYGVATVGLDWRI